MCTNATSAGTGVVQSPNFPGDYGIDYYGCTVTIIVPIGKRIQLTYTTFNLETYAAVLQVSKCIDSYKWNFSISVQIQIFFSSAFHISNLDF
jgi:hypothetical protein